MTLPSDFIDVSTKPFSWVERSRKELAHMNWETWSLRSGVATPDLTASCCLSHEQSIDSDPPPADQPEYTRVEPREEATGHRTGRERREVQGSNLQPWLHQGLSILGLLPSAFHFCPNTPNTPTSWKVCRLVEPD